MAVEGYAAEIGIVPAGAFTARAQLCILRHGNPATSTAYGAFRLAKGSVSRGHPAARAAVIAGHHLIRIPLITHRVFPYDFIIGRIPGFSKRLICPSRG